MRWGGGGGEWELGGVGCGGSGKCNLRS